MTTVLDASAILAFLQGEDGAAEVQEALEAGSTCGAANWSEVAQKVLGAGRDWDLPAALLHSYNIGIEPVVVADAERAARLWTRGAGLSLADRLCLALAERAKADVLTADRKWGSSGSIRQIR